MKDFNPFTADEAADYAESRATYATTLGELAAEAEREYQDLRDAGMRHDERSALPLIFTVDHPYIAFIKVPVDVVRDLAARHTHSGAWDEQLVVDNGGLIILGCGERFTFLEDDHKVTSGEEWNALVAQRNARLRVNRPE
ncbi:hypothetical protein [Streptomyces nanshensis]|uniref:Uncharacterized protein n=1 Tax=Streptomyces nanshensis TaxID=518642 RepID=A0A1E7KZJ2_9ACTN|nr:hypothetical protein [Streptomyces nanshensis]OEV09223.1 hypothetical protein AN218_22375 [Streptomyces nanshensis]